MVVGCAEAVRKERELAREERENGERVEFFMKKMSRFLERSVGLADVPKHVSAALRDSDSAREPQDLSLSLSLYSYIPEDASSQPLASRSQVSTHPFALMSCSSCHASESCRCSEERPDHQPPRFFFFHVIWSRDDAMKTTTSRHPNRTNKGVLVHSISKAETGRGVVYPTRKGSTQLWITSGQHKVA